VIWIKSSRARGVDSTFLVSITAAFGTPNLFGIFDYRRRGIILNSRSTSNKVCEGLAEHFEASWHSSSPSYQSFQVLFCLCVKYNSPSFNPSSVCIMENPVLRYLNGRVLDVHQSRYLLLLSTIMVVGIVVLSHQTRSNIPR